MLDMCSVTTLFPYLLVAGYGVILARSGVGYEQAPDERSRDRIIAWLAVVYTVFMIIARSFISGRGGSRTRACSRGWSSPSSRF
jgi:amino acid transporter